MAYKTADIHIRIQPSVKSQAEQVFAKTGHTASEVIEQFYIWTVKHDKTPMQLSPAKRMRIPDEATMTKQEVRQMLAEAKKQADKKTISLEEVRSGLEERYGTRV